MERVIERGCGLDVHKKPVTACVRVPSANGAREQHVRTFGTTTADLLARNTSYHDPGADYYDRRHTERARRRAVQALECQGYRVILELAA